MRGPQRHAVEGVRVQLVVLAVEDGRGGLRPEIRLGELAPQGHWGHQPEQWEGMRVIHQGSSHFPAEAKMYP